MRPFGYDSDENKREVQEEDEQEIQHHRPSWHVPPSLGAPFPATLKELRKLPVPPVDYEGE